MTTTLNPTLAPSSGCVGAEVSGVDLAAGVGPELARSLEQALAEYGVLFFPAPSDRRQGHRNLADALGDIVVPHAQLATLGDEGHPEIAVISSEIGNNVYANCWHSDVTWQPTPSRFSILQVQEAPPVGGDTMWSSQVAAFATLSEGLKDYLRPLRARHQLTPAMPERSAEHPVVIRHPLTGAEALFVNELFTTHIVGLPARESQYLLRMLHALATQPELTVRKRWQVGQMAVWDNHFVQHYAILDYGSASRSIARIEVRPEAPVPSVPST